MTDSAEIANLAQHEYWNDQAGRTWAALQTQLDRQLAPLGQRAMAALGDVGSAKVLDIGCGCGDTTLELAWRAGPAGRVTGIDLSAPMLEVARARAADHVTFVQADAQTATFDTPFDAAFSRFGVMFFADPPAAFANILRALRTGGRLAFVCWRTAAENAWMMVPLQAAYSILPPPEPEDPDAPGPFAFARAERVHDILTAAGFADVAIAPCDLKIGGFDVDTAVGIALRVGPLGRQLREAPHLAQEVSIAVRDALRAHMSADGVQLASATWIVTATRPG